MHIEKAQLESFIFDSGIVSKKDFEEAKKAAEISGQSVDRVLVNRGMIGNDDLRRARAYLLGFPFVDLKNQRFDFLTLSLIPEPVARHHNIVALRKSESGLEVALLETEDLSAIEFIGENTGLKILPRLTDEESMRQALLSYQHMLQSEFGDIIQRETSVLNGVAVVDALLKHALLQGASDIHIEPQENEVLVRYRVNGRLFEAMVLPPKSALSILVRIKALAGLKIEESESLQEGFFNVEREFEKVSFRVSIVPTLHGEKTTLHPLRENAKGFTLESLGFHGQGLEHVYQTLHHSPGVILVAGPENSGKTTTLYSMLDLVNAPTRNVATIEDPIEYRMPRVNQTQVRPEIGLTFASGLRALLRQDPDVIMVGELGGKEEMTLVLRASLAKCLVFGAIAGTSSASVLSRILNTKVDSLVLASNLKLVVTQRLARKLSSNKTKHFLTKKELETLGKSVDLDRMLKILKEEKVIGSRDTWGKVTFYKPTKDQEKDGFEGWVGLQEVLKVSSTIQNLIKSGGTATDFELQAKSEGMITLLEDGILKAVQGLTTIDEVLRVISE